MKGNKRTCTLSLGGNYKNTLDLFETSIQLINNEIGNVLGLSSIYTTKAWGMKEGTPDFNNQIIKVETTLSPKKLLKKTQKIEKILGRETKSINQEYCDRPIDIDILFFGNKIIEKKKLKVPHPLIQVRKFILVPLAELNPDYIHPILNKSIKELLLCCEDKLEVKRLTKK